MGKIAILSRIMLISIVSFALPSIAADEEQIGLFRGNAWNNAYKDWNQERCTWAGSTRTVVCASGAVGILGIAYSYLNRLKKPTPITRYVIPTVSVLCAFYPFGNFAYQTHWLAQRYKYWEAEGSSPLESQPPLQWWQRYRGAWGMTWRHFFGCQQKSQTAAKKDDQALEAVSDFPNLNPSHAQVTIGPTNASARNLSSGSAVPNSEVLFRACRGCGKELERGTFKCSLCTTDNSNMQTDNKGASAQTDFVEDLQKNLTDMNQMNEQLQAMLRKMPPTGEIRRRMQIDQTNLYGTLTNLRMLSVRIKGGEQECIEKARQCLKNNKDLIEKCREHVANFLSSTESPLSLDGPLQSFSYPEPNVQIDDKVASADVLPMEFLTLQLRRMNDLYLMNKKHAKILYEAQKLQEKLKQVQKQELTIDEASKYFKENCQPWLEKAEKHFSALSVTTVERQPPSSVQSTKGYTKEFLSERISYMRNLKEKLYASYKNNSQLICTKMSALLANAGELEMHLNSEELQSASFYYDLGCPLLIKACEDILAAHSSSSV